MITNGISCNTYISLKYNCAIFFIYSDQLRIYTKRAVKEIFYSDNIVRQPV